MKKFLFLIVLIFLCNCLFAQKDTNNYFYTDISTFLMPSLVEGIHPNFNLGHYGGFILLPGINFKFNRHVIGLGNTINFFNDYNNIDFNGFYIKYKFFHRKLEKKTNIFYEYDFVYQYEKDVFFKNADSLITTKSKDYTQLIFIGIRKNYKNLFTEFDLGFMLNYFQWEQYINSVLTIQDTKMFGNPYGFEEINLIFKINLGYKL